MRAVGVRRAWPAAHATWLRQQGKTWAELWSDVRLAFRDPAIDAAEELGVARGAPADEIKQAYRRLARQHHPDKVGDSVEAAKQAEAKMARINWAKEVLLGN